MALFRWLVPCFGAGGVSLFGSWASFTLVNFLTVLFHYFISLGSREIPSSCDTCLR